MSEKDYTTCPFKVTTASQCENNRNGGGCAACRMCTIVVAYRTLPVSITYTDFETLKEAAFADNMPMDKAGGLAISAFFATARHGQAKILDV